MIQGCIDDDQTREQQTPEQIELKRRLPTILITPAIVAQMRDCQQQRERLAAWEKCRESAR